MSRDEQVAARRYHVPAAEMYDEPHPEWRTVEVVRASDPDEPSATRCPYCGEPKVAHELISPTTCVLGSKSGYLPKSSSSSDCAAPDASSAATVEWAGTPVVSFGLVVSPMPRIKNDRLLYAEVVPAGSRWLPWRGRTSRWWFEVHAQHAPDEHGVSGTTYAYTEGGSGGAFTLRGCISKAMDAVDKFVWEDESDG